MKERTKVVQVLPADGWYGVIADIEIEPVRVHFSRLVAWALVKATDGSHQMRGVSPDTGDEDAMAFVDECAYRECDGVIEWLEYVHGEEIEEHKDRLQQLAENRREAYWEMRERAERRR